MKRSWNGWNENEHFKNRKESTWFAQWNIADHYEETEYDWRSLFTCGC